MQILTDSAVLLDQQALKLPPDKTSGTTAIMVAVHGMELVTANVGDSRAILVTTNGTR